MVDEFAELREKFRGSVFYTEYSQNNKYFSDSVLKTLGEPISRKANYRGEKGYNGILESDINVMKDLGNKYLNSTKLSDELIKQIIIDAYIDPDVHHQGMEINKVMCYPDGIVSIRRLISFNGVNIEKIWKDFEASRRTPIFFFPRDGQGENINTLRRNCFNDRIDHALFDIKNWCDIRKGKMEKAYQNRRTKEWLEKFNYDFGNIAEYYNIVGTFVEEGTYRVYNLETNGEVIDKYCDKYSDEWTEDYYKNLLIKISQYKKPDWYTCDTLK